MASREPSVVRSDFVVVTEHDYAAQCFIEARARAMGEEEGMWSWTFVSNGAIARHLGWKRARQGRKVLRRLETIGGIELERRRDPETDAWLPNRVRLLRWVNVGDVYQIRWNDRDGRDESEG